MGYYCRAFCKSSDVPTIRQVFQLIRSKGWEVSLHEGSSGEDIDSKDWKGFAFTYKEEMSPIIVDRAFDEGTENCLFREEIAEFMELIGPPGFSTKKRRVINHLKETKYIVACQLITTDIDDDGYDVNWLFLSYFADKCEAMLQCDNEGFYHGGKFILKT